LAIVVGTLVGAFAGYMGAVLVACVIFDAGNLCGLIGVFITGPVGSIAGGVAGWYYCRRRQV
jgi:hypothetical protein